MSLANSKSVSPGTRLLLVDDNEAGLAARKSVLEELGYWITTATDPEEALTYFKHGGFALVVTDFKMPKMTGLELIVQLRELEPQLPIILIKFGGNLRRGLGLRRVAALFLRPGNGFAKA